MNGGSMQFDDMTQTNRERGREQESPRRGRASEVLNDSGHMTLDAIDENCL